MRKVAILNCPSYDQAALAAALERGIALLGGWGAFIRPGMTVLLKVNLIGPKPPESAAVTHPEFVRSLVRILRAHGCRVWIGDSSGGAIAGLAPTAKSLEIAGMNAVAREEGAEIKNFDREGVVEVAPASGLVARMHLARPAFEADLVINLPKLKTHSSGLYTGAIKNAFGFVPGLRKAFYHRMAPDPVRLGEILADINQAVPIGLHIMDGIVAMQGSGPTAGRSYPAGKILMAVDPLALDLAAARMIGADPDSVTTLHAARRRGLWASDLSEVEVVGDYDRPPVLHGFKLPPIRQIRGSGSGILVGIIDFLKARPVIDNQRCRDCGVCVESCPVGAIERRTKSIAYEKCIECLCCHELCMHQAVRLKRTNPVARALAKVMDPR